MWIAFSRKFDSIKLQTFKFENIRLNLARSRSEVIVLVETMVAMNKQ